MLQEQAYSRASADVTRIEEELEQTLSAWRDLPEIPSAADYQQWLAMAPFAEPGPPPPKPDYADAEAVFQAELRRAIEAHEQPTSLERYLWLWVTIFGLPIVGVMAPLVGGGTWFAMYWRRRDRIRTTWQRRIETEWPTRRRELERAYGEAVADRLQRGSADARTAWANSEQQRIAGLQKLLEGNLDAIENVVTGAIESLDFPFEAQCTVAVDDDDHVLVDVDLPEIEDIIPETQMIVRKNGAVAEKKRKVADRNRLYAELVTGIALEIAATAFAEAPTLKFVTVAGRTQRARRGSSEIVDDYVYEAKIPRELFAHFGPATADPLEAFRLVSARMHQNANGSLRTIAAPTWVDAVAAE